MCRSLLELLDAPGAWESRQAAFYTDEVEASKDSGVGLLRLARRA